MSQSIRQFSVHPNGDAPGLRDDEDDNDDAFRQDPWIITVGRLRCQSPNSLDCVDQGVLNIFSAAADFRNSPLSITGIPQGTSGAEGLG